jgi:8-oxo-dGTP pyrophosphatase MutT (NUDIX family)
MPRDLLKTIIAELPRYAEEEGDFYGVERRYLIVALSTRNGVEPAVAENTVKMCECLLDSLSLLQVDDLTKGVWNFESFPAQLLATSVLTAISDSDSRLFATNSWSTRDISYDRKDQQRDVLRYIEQARFEHHAGKQAQPIRYCYVAWSIIKLDGKILFYQREDTQKRFDKSAGDYGLIGGRANQNDVSGVIDKIELLKALQSPNSQVIKNALPETLKRELREETGLLFEMHYNFKLWRTLKPYRQIQGAAPNHALTEYYLHIFQIELTLEGFLHLQQRVKSDSRLAWFSLTDIERGETIDGKIPYIKALYDEFAGNYATLAAELSALPDSFFQGYLSDKETYGITLPINPENPVTAGRLGKEKPLDLALSPRQLMLILGLAAHLRGFEFASLEKNIVLHPHGWMEVDAHSPVRVELMELAAFLNGSDLVMENRQDRLFRLSIRPETVFFADELFSFRIAGDELENKESMVSILIGRQGFATALGIVKDKIECFELTRGFVKRMKILADGDFTIHDAEAVSTEYNYKKGLHKDPKFKALGFRNLIRQDGKGIRFVVPYICK